MALRRQELAAASAARPVTSRLTFSRRVRAGTAHAQDLFRFSVSTLTVPLRGFSTAFDHLTADFGDLAFQAADPGPRGIAHDVDNCRGSNFELVFLSPFCRTLGTRYRRAMSFSSSLPCSRMPSMRSRSVADFKLFAVQRT